MSDRDRDDWFAEPERPEQPPAVDDDWLAADGERPAGRAPLPGWVRPAAIAAGAVVVLLLVLWASGVFSGGSAAPPQPATTSTTVPTTTTAPTTTAPAVAAPTATLKPGDTGAQVTTLQRALTQLGYSPGKADGSYGPATTQAVKQFQAAHGLQADGVVGPKTLAALQSALASSG